MFKYATIGIVIVLIVCFAFILDEPNAAAAPTYYTSFEGPKGFSGWTIIAGTPDKANGPAHEGSKSYYVNENADALYRQISTSPQSGLVIFWFYDTPTDTSAECMVGITLDSQSQGGFFIGVNTTVSTNKYVIINGVDTNLTVTTIARSAGWHNFTFMANGNQASAYIDGTSVSTSTAFATFTRIQIGDWWYGNEMVAYIDDISVWCYPVPDLPIPMVVSGATFGLMAVAIFSIRKKSN